MPVVLEGAADLVLIAGLFVLIGLLMAMQHTFVPMLNALGNFDTHIPHIGKPFRGITAKAVNAINNGIGRALEASHKAISGLFAGLVWSIMQVAHAVNVVAQDAEDAFGYLVDHKIPQIINAAIRNAELNAGAALSTANAAAHSVAAALAEAKAYVGTRIVEVEHDIATAEAAAKAYAATNIAAAAVALTHNAGQMVSDLAHSLDTRLDKLEGSIDSKLAAATAAAERVAKTAVSDAIDDALAAGGVIDKDIQKIVSGAIAKAIAAGAPTDTAIAHAVSAAVSAALGPAGDIESRIQADISRAIGAVVTIGGPTLTQVQDLIDRAVAGAVHVGGVTTDEVHALINAAITDAVAGGGLIADVLDDVRRRIDDTLSNLDLGNLAAVGAAVAAVTATVALTIAETGLDNAGCRSKVKDICGTNTSGWGNLIFGLAAFSAGLSLEELVEIGQDLVVDLESAAGELIGNI